jgi:alpha-mannosidase
VHDDRKLIEDRLDRVLRERIRPAVYPHTVPLSVEVWHAPGEPVLPAEGIAAQYQPTAVGDRWGPAWGTSWFRFTGVVSDEWAGQTVEAVIDLGFDRERPGFSAEGLVYRPDGTAIKGLNPRNQWVRLGAPASGGETVQFYVEAASNPEIVGPVTLLGDPRTAGDEPLYRLERAELAVFDETVLDLVLDLEVLGELMHELPVEDPRRWEILRTIERALDAINLQDVPATAAAARAELAPALAAPARASAHQLSAVGHAHIDSAWLWPVRETVRKVARTASNVMNLMDDHPEFVFAMSQAQQLAWIKDHRPDVYARVREKVQAGQFIPVGGMWVEADTNMPGGEAMARQFVHGKRFFLDEFGIDTHEVWLPDSFGYSAALPQLVALSGSRWFLTQKLSWNQTNPFPHHTFWWEGIDGTRIFTHFPPVDTYNVEFSGAEMARAVANFREKGRATGSLAPFGHGDGGGGPTREMLGRAARLRDLDGSPRVAIEPPAEFFAKAEAEYPDAPVWVGELYLELHRGTYTSQAKAKQGNRRSEHLLREAELWATTAAVRTARESGAPGDGVPRVYAYPHEQLDRIWKTVLLHQFHDILPGSSIAWVHRQARDTYAAVADELNEIITTAQQALTGPGDQPIVFNAAPHSRGGVPAGGAGMPQKPDAEVTVTEISDCWVLDNNLLRVTIDRRGLITSVVDLAAGRETIPPGAVANLLQLHPDLPNYWDAWDIDAHYRNTVADLTDADTVTLTAKGPNSATVQVVRSVGTSTITQLISLAAGAKRVDIDTEIDWHETETLLKAAFPIDIRAEHSAAETQFGHVKRPTHTNTSWETAKFEICAHRYIHLAEPGWGAAVVNDSIYGHDVTRTIRDDGGTTTTIRLSLLRAPRFPDPDTDHGTHHLRYALAPGASIIDATREGYGINLPERVAAGTSPVVPLVTLDNDDVIIEAIKLADDQSGDVIIRLYEATGARVSAQLSTSFPLATATETDLLERHLDSLDTTTPDSIPLQLRPFQIRTLRLTSRTPI